MDEEAFNMSIRRFLKNVGVAAQREIETAVRAAVEEGHIGDDATLLAKVTLEVEEVNLRWEIEGDITLA